MGIIKFNYIDKIYEDYCNFKSKYDKDDKILSFESLIIYNFLLKNLLDLSE